MSVSHHDEHHTTCPNCDERLVLLGYIYAGTFIESDVQIEDE